MTENICDFCTFKGIIDLNHTLVHFLNFMHLIIIILQLSYKINTYMYKL